MKTREHPVRDAAVALVAGLSTWVTLFSWGGFVERNDSYLAPLLLGIILVAAVGILTRMFRLPLVTVFATQLLMVVLFINWAWGSQLVPTPSSIESIIEATRAAVDSARKFAAPVPATAPSIAPLLVMGGLICYLLIDLIAVSLRRATAAGLPLLLVYTVPISALDSSVNWSIFAISALGYLSMIALQESVRVGRWGRTVGEDHPIRAFNGLAGTGRHPLGMAAGAIAIALVLPLVIPTMQLGVFGIGGAGSGTGSDREVSINNPLTDLRRDLVRGEDLPLLRITTEESAPSYVRISTLTNYSGETWTPGPRNLPERNAATGRVPLPTGMPPDLPRQTFDWQVEVDEQLDSQWLPTSEYVAVVEAGSDWRFDSEVLDFHGADDEVTTRGLDYNITSLVPEIRQERLRVAGPAPREFQESYVELPDDVPEIVRDLADEVTRGEESDYDRAMSLQEWFRDPELFEYSTERSAGNGNEDLESFLSEDGRVGYCEQYASAMAVMTRSLGIPSRVAVGFLQSERLKDDTFEFSSHDLHAWPELYFEGTGWVRFEPTPADRASTTPTWTQNNTTPTDRPTAQPTQDDPSQAPTTGATRRPSQQPSQDEVAAAAGDSSEDSGTWLMVSAVLGAVLVLVLVGLLPRTLRQARTRARRQSSEPAESVWDELRDLMIDLGHRWPVGRSPRAVGEFVTEHFASVDQASTERPRVGAGENPDADAALDRLVHQIEEGRYAASSRGISREEAERLLDTCRAALLAGVTPRARRRASWLPASVIGGRRRAARRTTAGFVRTNSDTVDHIG